MSRISELEKRRLLNSINVKGKKKPPPSKIDLIDTILSELNISINLNYYIENNKNLNPDDIFKKLIPNKRNNIEKNLDELLKIYNFNVNEYNYISFLDICILLNIFYKEKIDIDKIKNTIKSIIQNDFNNILIYLKNNYFCNLAFDYSDNDNKIKINTENIMNNTINNLKNNFSVLEDILINIINDNKFRDFKDEKEFYDKYIRDVYHKKINNKFIYGYCKSVLYDYNNINEYNINKKYLDLKYHDDSIDYDKLKDDIKKNLIYYDINSKKITKRTSNFNLKNKRIILSKDQLDKYYEMFNLNFNNFSELKEIIIKLKEEQESLLKDIKFIDTYNNQIDYNILNNNIKKKIKNILKSNSNIQYNEDYIKELKILLKKELDKLNNEIKNILIKKENIIDKIPKYNNFINKYSLWINNIINLLNNYPKKSNQYIVLNNIFNYYITNDDIIKWKDNCKINNLNYWLPVKTKLKTANTFFINLINNKVSWKINNDDIIIYNSTNLNDKIYCWDNSLTNISLPKLDNEVELINIVLKGYYKASKKIEMNDFNILKPLIDKCIKNKDKTLFENSCKNMITIFDLIKEIVKSKYKFGLNQEILKNLENNIELYKKNLLNLLPK